MALISTDPLAHRTTVKLSPELRTAIHIRGALENMTQTQIIERACWHWLGAIGETEHQELRIKRLLKATS